MKKTAAIIMSLFIAVCAIPSKGLAADMKKTNDYNNLGGTINMINTEDKAEDTTNDNEGVQVSEDIQAIATINVDANYTGDDGAAVEGIKTFSTVGAAINSVPADNKTLVNIYIKSGIYKEKLVIDRPFIKLIGDSAEDTKITFDDASGTPRRDDNSKTYGTTGSASVTIKADDFEAQNITFENSFDEVASTYKDKQAVAVKSEGDRMVFRNCRFIGNQDTLYPNKGTQYYENCYIEGDVDFIFGGAQAVFEKCDIFSYNRNTPPNNGYVTAASTLISNKYGYLFENCRLLSDAAKGSVQLGRPWPAGGNKDCIGAVVYKNCYMGEHISETGWVDMSGLKASDARLYEYGSTGPGAIESPTRRVLSDAEAEEYTLEKVLNGWNPNN